MTAWAGGPPSPQVLGDDAWHRLAHSLSDLFGWRMLLIAVGAGLIVLGMKYAKKLLK